MRGLKAGQWISTQVVGLAQVEGLTQALGLRRRNPWAKSLSTVNEMLKRSPNRRLWVGPVGPEWFPLPGPQDSSRHRGQRNWKTQISTGGRGRGGFEGPSFQLPGTISCKDPQNKGRGPEKAATPSWFYPGGFFQPLLLISLVALVCISSSIGWEDWSRWTNYRK